MSGSNVTGPSFLALQVRDLDGAAAFYESKLGLTRAAQSPPGAIVFATSPIAFAVRNPLPARTSTPAGPAWESPCGWPATTPPTCTIGWAADGVPILTEPFDGPFELTFVFRDPEGYAVTIHEAA